MYDSRPQIEAQMISRRHPDGRRWLLDHVSLAIRAGISVAIIGPSGSGKTLLLRALAKLDPIDTGEIRFQGRPIDRKQIPHYRSRAIYLHQRPVVLERWVEAAFQRPFLLKAHQGRSYSSDWILRMLLRLGRDKHFLEKPASELSGGEIQLLALLRVLQLDPIVLLLDEPTASLDSDTEAEVENVIMEWRAESAGERAIVWVTHDMDQAGRIADHTIRMDQGKIEDGG